MNGEPHPILDLLHPTTRSLMVLLWEQDDRSTRELGRLLNLHPHTLPPHLKRLMDAGIVTRRRSAPDGKKGGDPLLYSLTDAGRDLFLR